MAQEKRGTWWGIHPKEGKKGFATEAEAKAWEEGKKAAPVEKPKDEEPDAG